MKKVIGIIAVLAVLLCVGFYIYKWEFREPVLEVSFFYLNRGRSIFIRTPHGETVLIDGGQNSEVLRELSKATPFYRRRIDTVVVTSAASKNVGGLIDVLERYEVERVVMPSLMGTSTALSAFEKILRKKKLFPEEVQRGDRFEIGSAYFDVLFPDPDFKFNKTSTPEMVLSLTYGTTTLLFLGDTSITIQKRIARDVESAYLVEFAHGATKSRVSADLLGKFEPKVIVSTKRAETLRFIFR
jgi:competence protein ComEC